MTSEGFGEMFESESADTCTDPGARTSVGAGRILVPNQHNTLVIMWGRERKNKFVDV
jgi:hypothetical protein